MRTPLILAALAGLTLCPAAHADKFYLGSKEAAAKVQNDEELGLESQLDVVEGVLLSEEDGVLQIRTVGGIVYLQKSMVYKTESDSLTVAVIEDMEASAAEDDAEVDAARRALLAAEREIREIRFANAAARREAAAVEASAPRVAVPVEASMAFDPVLDVAVPVDAVALPLDLALELRYDRTGLARDAKVMRMARRMR